MCKDCGCNHGGDVHVNGHSMAEHSHGHGHHASGEHVHTQEVNLPVLAENDRLAERNRGFFEAKKILVMNVFSSPGSGKTALLQATARLMKGRLRLGVIVGDLATENDADRLREAGVPVVQITTGTMCHLDAGMIARAMKELDMDNLDVLVIENVGNLVCPAAYDLGERIRVVLLSTTEGEDKPLKYPPMFHSANMALITKMDLAEAVEFNRELALANLERIAHHAKVFEISSKTGLGMEEWCQEIIHLYHHVAGEEHSHQEGCHA